jgi:hypothetical protein
MVDDYQLAEDNTLVGYEPETTNGVDPAGTNGGLFEWPGIVPAVNSLTEDLEQRVVTAVGSRSPDPTVVLRKKNRFEIEIVSMVAVDWATIVGDELFSFAMGTVNATTGVVTFARPLRTFTMEWGSDNPGTKWFHVLSGCKINSITWSWRGDDFIEITMNIHGRVHSPGETVVTRAGGTDLDALTIANIDSAHGGNHTTFTFNTVPTTSEIDVDVLEFELTLENNLTPKWTDSQSLNPSHLREGLRRVSWSLTTQKKDNDLLDIFRNDPAQQAGQVDLQVVVSQPSGWYMDFDMPVCTMKDPNREQTEEQDAIEETFAGLVVGTPAVDFNLAA